MRPSSVGSRDRISEILMSEDRFLFTITDLARFLGKSPVTLRGWERKGLMTFPRDDSGDRKLNPDQVIKAARMAHVLGRIKDDRLFAVETSMNNMIYFEMENAKKHAKNRTHRSAGIGENGASGGSSG